MTDITRAYIHKVIHRGATQPPTVKRASVSKKPLIINNSLIQDLVAELHRMFLLHTEDYTIHAGPDGLTIKIKPEHGTRFITQNSSISTFSNGVITTTILKEL